MSTDINWHPLTEDVVFEDGGFYLISFIAYGDVCIHKAYYDGGKRFPFQTESGNYSRKHITHYARVNEP